MQGDDKNWTKKCFKKNSNQKEQFEMRIILRKIQLIFFNNKKIPLKNRNYNF